MKTYITKIDGKYYAFAADTTHNQVYGIGRDRPEKGLWFASWSSSGIQYVATPSPTRSAAYQKARHAGEYCGEV